MPLTVMATRRRLRAARRTNLSNGGKLTDIKPYINFFTKPAAQGGVKANPDDVILAAITAPSDPVGVDHHTPCADQTAPSCPILNHSCIDATNPSSSATRRCASTRSSTRRPTTR